MSRRLRGLADDGVARVERPLGHVSEATRQKVLATAEALGYHLNTPARQLASGVTNTIGLVARRELRADRRRLVPRRDAPRARLRRTRIRLSRRGRVDRARRGDLRVAAPGGAGRRAGGLRSRADDEELKRLVADGFPIIIHGSRPDLAVSSVDVDNVAGARLAVEHLIGLGHRRIACVIFDLSYVAARERLQGYEAALGDAGIAVDPDLIAETGYRVVSTQSAVTDLLARDDYTAVFAAADITAAGVLGALRRAGRRVPDDTSLVGFDDIPLAEFLDPPLTTIRVPAVQVGEAVGRALLDRLAGHTEVRRILLPVELMVRASSAPPANGRQGDG